MNIKLKHFKDTIILDGDWKISFLNTTEDSNHETQSTKIVDVYIALHGGYVRKLREEILALNKKLEKLIGENYKLRKENDTLTNAFKIVESKVNIIHSLIP